MAKEAMDASKKPSSGVALFLCDEDAHTPAFAPIQLHGDITLQELAEEYCITSVLECDSTGCVQPRAVALDSPLDTLRGGKYYIARRDLPRVGCSPRVTFRGKITVEEFEADHVLGRQQQGKEKENHGPVALSANTATAVTSIASIHPATRKRPRDDEESNDDDDDDYEKGANIDGVDADDDGVNMNDVMDVTRYKFVPFVGDLYGDGREAMIRLEDAKRLCENVESDELMFAARHAEAENILAEAKRVLLDLTP
ncbi:hypothetical protein MOQ_009327 [Trypanosoma cruzi marinkellei]|uniref:Uncharacterized protein n=1 Tax=Trypanosoma cruzi marinkellei TaxID=85056 RepID=K2MX90_TRYCR|nr:hypothetical protein MOQ_009327 [Trypanosoma cruzi marinkellei]